MNTPISYFPSSINAAAGVIIPLIAAHPHCSLYLTLALIHLAVAGLMARHRQVAHAVLHAGGGCCYGALALLDIFAAVAH